MPNCLLLVEVRDDAVPLPAREGFPTLRVAVPEVLSTGALKEAAICVVGPEVLDAVSLARRIRAEAPRLPILLLVPRRRLHEVSEAVRQTPILSPRTECLCAEEPEATVKAIDVWMQVRARERQHQSALAAVSAQLATGGGQPMEPPPPRVEGHARQAEAMAKVGRALISPWPLDEQLRGCAEAIVETLSAALVQIWVSSAGTPPQLRASAGLSGAAMGVMERTVDRVAQERRSRIFNELPAASALDGDGWARQHGLEAFVAHPLEVGEEVVGVVAMFSRHAISEFAIECLSSLGDQIALGIARAVSEDSRAALAQSERDAREQAERNARAREEILGIVSHDLRNPLTAIHGASMMLRRYASPEDAKARRHLEAIDRNVVRMTQLLNDLLDITSIDAGTLQVSPRPHQALPIVAETVDMLRPAAEQKHISLEGDAEAAVWAMCDRERTLQVLSNLVGNAVKYTMEGGAVRIEARPGNAEVVFSVADNGPGIDPGNVPHLFDRYWQAKRKARSGIGLGLSIARGIVETHGGRIWVDSVVGKGSTFHFTLPAAQRMGPDASWHVLIVEDDDATRMALVDALSTKGYRVKAVGNGRDALAALEDGRPELLLVDLGLPGELSGGQLRAQVKQDERFSRIPAVVMSGEHGLRAHLGAAAPDDYLLKPFSNDRLLEVVRRFCGQPRSGSSGGPAR